MVLNKGIVAIWPLIKRMSYYVKIKRYKVPITHEKKCIIFLILNLSGPNTDYGSLVSWGRHSGGGKPKAQPPGASSDVCFIDKPLKKLVAEMILYPKQ